MRRFLPLTVITCLCVWAASAKVEAVYRLLNIDRGVPEVWGSTYDVRALVDASVKLRDGRKLTDMELPLMGRIALKEALKKIEGTDLEKFLRQYNAI